MEITTKIRMYVSTEPTETDRFYKDGENTKTWTKESVSGLVLGAGLENVIADLQFRSSRANVTTRSAKFGDFAKTFYRNEEDFIAGNKVLVANVAMNPRVNRSGDDAGLATQWAPTILGFEVVEATEEDKKEIDAFRKIASL